jgi:hypothetical protein
MAMRHHRHRSFAAREWAILADQMPCEGMTPAELPSARPPPPQQVNYGCNRGASHVRLPRTHLRHPDQAARLFDRALSFSCHRPTPPNAFGLRGRLHSACSSIDDLTKTVSKLVAFIIVIDNQHPVEEELASRIQLNNPRRPIGAPIGTPSLTAPQCWCWPRQHAPYRGMRRQVR